MAQIGSFTRGEDGTLTGTIRTLTLNVKTRLSSPKHHRTRRLRRCAFLVAP